MQYNIQRMGQEYQRILSELSSLQSQLLNNELPLILSMSLSVPHEQISILSDRILALQQSHFISPVALNISAIKNEINKHKFQNTELKELARRQQMDLALIREKIQDVNKEKDILSKELSQLKAKQMSLGMLINSSNMEGRIKQILKQNQQLKQNIKQKSDSFITQTAQLKQIKQKQAFYISQIKALQNDNTLFYHDLTNANNEISRLNTHIKTLSQSVPNIQSSHMKINQSLRLEIIDKSKIVQELNGHLNNLKISNQRIVEQLDRSKKVNKEIIDANNELKTMLQNQDLQKKHLEQELQLNLSNNIQNQRKHRQNILGFQQKINEMVNQINHLNDQLHHQHQQFSIVNQQANQSNNMKLVNLELELNDTKIKLQCQQKQCSDLKFTVDQMRAVHQRQLYSIRAQDQNRITQIITKANQEKQGLLGQLSLAQTTIEQLQSQIADEQSQAEYYKQYLHQNNQLKVELQRALKSRIQRNSETGRNNKWNFQLMQLREDILRLSKQNNQLKTITLSLLDSTRKWTIKQTNKLVCSILQKKAHCETCQHWQKYENSKKTLTQSKSAKQLKSVQDLKALNEKYKLIRQQNQIFGSRIQHIIRD